MADGQLPVLNSRAWRREVMLGFLEAQAKAQRGHEAGLTCQFDVLSKVLGSSGGSEPEQCCEAPS